VQQNDNALTKRLPTRTRRWRTIPRSQGAELGAANALREAASDTRRRCRAYDAALTPQARSGGSPSRHAVIALNEIKRVYREDLLRSTARSR
jgi:hypothetical protein